MFYYLGQLQVVLATELVYEGFEHSVKGVVVGFGELMMGQDLVEGIVEGIEDTQDGAIVGMAYSHKDVLAMNFECLVKTMASRVLEDSMVGDKYYKA